MSEQNIITTIEDDSGYRSTLAYILMTDEVDGTSINEDVDVLSDIDLVDKFENTLHYIFRRRIIDNLYGSDVGEGNLSEKPVELTDEQWRLILVREAKHRNDYVKYIYPFERDKYAGFFKSDTSSAVEMSMVDYIGAEYNRFMSQKITTADGQIITISHSIISIIDSMFAALADDSITVSNELKKDSHIEHYRRDGIDLYGT